MAVRSMTAYATTSLETVAGTLTIELKSVNSRFLDLQFRMNDEFRAYEPFFRESIMQNIRRGKVECRLSFARGAQNPSSMKLNHDLLRELSGLQREIREQYPEAQAMTGSSSQVRLASVFSASSAMATPMRLASS